MKIDLFYFSDTGREIQDWPLGDSISVSKSPKGLSSFLRSKSKTLDADIILFWDLLLGDPDAATVQQVAQLPGDVWHAGLRLGTSGLPRMIDFVTPTSMLNRDPDADRVASSWRLSFRACLMKSEVLEWLGTIDSGYENLLAAGLDVGYQCINRGVFVRNAPELLSSLTNVQSVNKDISLQDELRFIAKFFGSKWAVWAMWRAAMNGYSPTELLHGWKKLRGENLAPSRGVYEHNPKAKKIDPAKGNNRVTVLIPTLQRYPYLRQVLRQLEKQTIKPMEVIVADQTPENERDLDLVRDFPNLPLNVIYLDRPGQCTSRNAGLRNSKGDFILFLDDDDDDLPVDLIDQHLRTLLSNKAEVSLGVANEVEAGPLPEDFAYLRTSIVFPTGNTMILRSLLERSGLFDPAFDRGERADHDLGMRCYLAGALMVLNPEIRVKHLRAPRGGLREHGARKITYAASRKEIWKRQIMSPTEIYLAKKYFTPLQVRESILQRTFGTFSIKGNWAKKLFKIGISSLFLPHTLWRLRCNKAASQTLKDQSSKKTFGFSPN